MCSDSKESYYLIIVESVVMFPLRWNDGTEQFEAILLARRDATPDNAVSRGRDLPCYVVSARRPTFNWQNLYKNSI